VRVVALRILVIRNLRVLNVLSNDIKQQSYLMKQTAVSSTVEAFSMSGFKIRKEIWGTEVTQWTEWVEGQSLHDKVSEGYEVH